MLNFLTTHKTTRQAYSATIYTTANVQTVCISTDHARAARVTRRWVHAFKQGARNASTTMLVQLGCGELLVTGPQQLNSKGGLSL